ncbi:NLGN [Mytilus edulis]|uniref:Carboxylic ester hydrolase n=1 Tax=Mytilus edulis TaxID=6550 RepID=A0A8S3TXZ0_MYTED|nr:NLGN [Mytilus edulis]
MVVINTFLLFSLTQLVPGILTQPLPGIHTSVGLINGFVDLVNFNVNGRRGFVSKYLGIPYAVPPVGNLRFRKPKPAPRFKQPFNATQFGPGCLQNKFLMSLWLPGRDLLSEDCLTLNIFVPIHTVVAGKYPVTINYRLGPFGFLATKDPDSLGNLGLWDQQLAIKWVHENIDFFGGDSNRITLFGESAGGGSTVYQAMYPGNKGLFSRTISESGVAMSAWGYNTRDKMLDFTKRMATNLKCPTTNDRDMLACMRNMPAQDIVDKSRVGTESENLFRPEFVPAPDDEFISQYAPDIFTKPCSISDQTGSVFDNIDMAFVALTGDGTVVTGATMLPYVKKHMSKTMSPDDVIEKFVIPHILSDSFNVTSPELAKIMNYVYGDWNKTLGNNSYQTKLLNVDTDYSFFIPIINTAIAHAQREKGKKTYLLGFEKHSSFTLPLDYKPPNLHADEIPYFFGFPDSMMKPFAMSRTNITAEEIQLSKKLMDYIANFAYTGDPNLPIPPDVKWLPYDVENEHYLRVGETIETGSHMLPMRTAFWTKYIPEYLKMTKTCTISHGLLPNIGPSNVIENSCGFDPNGTSCIGCGLQEEFYNCADISIGGDDVSKNTYNTPHILKPTLEQNVMDITNRMLKQNTTELTVEQTNVGYVERTQSSRNHLSNYTNQLTEPAKKI